MKIFILFILLFNYSFSGTLKPLTILMDFQDYRHQDLHNHEETLTNKRAGYQFSPELYSNMFFNEKSYKGYNNKELMSAKRYFELESGGSFNLTGTKDDIYGWYTSEHNAKFYGNNISKQGDRAGAADLIREGVKNLVKNKVDFSKYDLNNDQTIDCIVLIFAGKGEQFENSLGSNAIWPHYNTFSDISKGLYIYFDDHLGKTWRINRYTLVPQDIPLDLYVHEISHFLGVGDLYGKNSTIGYWSNMSSLYSGDDILGSKFTSLGAYHRANLQDIYRKKDIHTQWAKKIKLDWKHLNLIDEMELHKSSEKNKKNLIKIMLSQEDIPVSSDNDMFYSNNFFNYGSNFIISTYLPKNKENTFHIDKWYSSNIDRKNTRIYVRPEGDFKWTLIGSEENKDESIDKSRKWLERVYNLNEFAGKHIEIKGTFLPSIKRWRKGVYFKDLEIRSNNNTIFSVNNSSDILLNGFIRSQGDEKLEEYLLIEYRVAENESVDEGLKYTPTLPYPNGLVVWHINEQKPEKLVNILPFNSSKSYEVIDGDLKELKTMNEVVSSRVITKFDIPEVAIEKNNQYFYREPIQGQQTYSILDKVKLDILHQEQDKIILKFNQIN